MTEEQLQKILDSVWMRDWSADDGFDAIWGEEFEGVTRPIEPTNGRMIPDAMFEHPQKSASPTTQSTYGCRHREHRTVDNTVFTLDAVEQMTFGGEWETVGWDVYVGSIKLGSVDGYPTDKDLLKLLRKD